MKSAFLPVGLMLAFIVAWLFPTPGQQLNALGMIPWVVVAIFFINGYQINLAELPRNRQFLTVALLAIVINLLLAPLLGVLAVQLSDLSHGAALGLLVKTAVPATLSTCIVLTQLAGGYGLWALVLTLLLNVLGVFSLPFVLSLTLSNQIAINIDPLALLQNLLLLVLLPFAIGTLLSRRPLINPQHIVLQYLPSSCVIAAVWMSLSSSNALFNSLQWRVLLEITLLCTLVHITLLVCALIASRLVQIDWQARVALVFTAGQKTLPVAVSVLTALENALGEALLVCVVFHFLQLLIDALLPRHIRCWCQLSHANCRKQNT